MEVEDWGIQFGERYEDPAKTCEPEKSVSIAMAVFVILIVIVGLFGNAIVFFVILALREFRKSVSNWYVLQLALADTLFLLMLPFTASEQLVGKWDFSEALCKAREGIMMVNYYASILFLTMMSFDRYMAVTKSGVSPWVDVLRRLDSAALISLVIWITSVCLTVPLYLYSHVTECSTCAYNFPVSDSEMCAQSGVNESACPEWIRKENAEEDSDYVLDPQYVKEVSDLFNNIDNISEPLENRFGASEDSCMSWPPKKSYKLWLYFNFSVLLVLPIVLICAFYGLILRAMMGTSAAASTNQKQYRRRVTLMVLGLVMLFAISWVPWYGVKIAHLNGIPIGSVACRRLVSAVTTLSYMNSALNPYFYSFMGSRFHQRFLRARTTATRKSRFISFLSRVYWSRHESTHSTSGSCRIAPNNNTEIKLTRVKLHSEEESSNTRSNRTERTQADANAIPAVSS